MEPAFALAFGIMVATAVYLVLSRNVLRLVLGLLILSNAVNLAIFLCGRLESRVPPLVPPGEATIALSANPLPQALILTAIVISFSIAAFTVVMFEAAHRRLDTLDTEAMRVAEPETRMPLAPLPQPAAPVREAAE